MNGYIGLQKKQPSKIYGLIGTPLCMVACIAIGYLLGSSTIDSSSSSTIMGKVGIKSSNYSSSVQTMADQQTTKHTSIIEELIPTKLLPLYSHDNLLKNKLQFNITRSMLRQSRPVVGNTQRLHAYIKKLQSNQCTTVLFLGGSVTAGHNGGGTNNSYPRRFMDWLNERYPCVESNGKAGMHITKRTQAASSLTHFIIWESVVSIKNVDLVLVEFNVNDSFINELPHALEDKGEIGETMEYQSSWYFEVLIRRLLLLRKPDPVAIITFNADYIGRAWSPPPHGFNPAIARQMLFRRNHEPLKIYVSSMYEIPVFSAVIWMLPLAGKKGIDWQFNRTANPYNTADWHADRCCHPKAGGHLLLSLVLAYCFIEEEKIMQSYNEDDTAHGERDFTMDASPILREPLYLSHDEDAMYVRNSLATDGFDFTDSNAGEKSWEESIVANSGWTWRADNKDKDKFGYIADGVEGGQHIAMSLVGGVHGMVEISFVISYESFGVALVWLDSQTENTHQDQCKVAQSKVHWNKKKKKTRPNAPQLLVARWDHPASVPTVNILDKKLVQGMNKTLHICLTPRSEENQEGSSNKFKLLGVRVY